METIRKKIPIALLAIVSMIGAAFASDPAPKLGYGPGDVQIHARSKPSLGKTDDHIRQMVEKIKTDETESKSPNDVLSEIGLSRVQDMVIYKRAGILFFEKGWLKDTECFDNDVRIAFEKAIPLRQLGMAIKKARKARQETGKDEKYYEVLARFISMNLDHLLQDKK